MNEHTAFDLSRGSFLLLDSDIRGIELKLSIPISFECRASLLIDFEVTDLVDTYRIR